MSDIIVDYNPYTIPVCDTCKYYKRGTLSCEAFTKIPSEILRSKNNHSKPLPSQKNNLVYSPKK